ncbi:MAG TPA: GNAT family N-acetyltransferase [Chryseolinea sp.]|nr:GNAT family N-acetyltransferase [Chryseolinea sp.]
MIVYTTSQNDNELKGILNLQKANLARNLHQEEIENQGFVTVLHRLEDLQKMNAIEQHIIAKDDDTVVAYLLAMTEKSKFDIPVLVPMFEMFETIQYKNKPLSKYNYMVVGQVCVHKKYRGQGVLDKCYDLYIDNFRQRYDFAVTEIATSNQRSLNAHKRIGFRTIHEYAAPDGEQWAIVLLEWPGK